MKKEKRDDLYDLIDRIFNSINDNQKQKGGGKSFFYNLRVVPGKTKEVPTTYEVDISIKEVGYPERILQTLMYTKPDGMDRYRMEYEVFASMLTIFAEATVFHWNELGKLLNVDTELQESAIKAK